MELPAILKAAIFQHAEQEAAKNPPLESAGIIAHGRYIRLENIAAEPEKSFAIAASDLAKYSDIQAIVHSHPAGPHWPSEHDMQQQIATDIPWLIAVVPTKNDPDIRPEIFGFGGDAKFEPYAGYRHGVADCYSLIRGFYREKMGIDLPDIPRRWDWWHDGDDLYVKGFAPAGFTILPKSTPLKRGDIFLARVRAPVINHAGLWLGGGLIHHHIGGCQGYQPQRIPRKEPAERWQKFIETWIRYSPKK